MHRRPGWHQSGGLNSKVCALFELPVERQRFLRLSRCLSSSPVLFRSIGGEAGRKLGACAEVLVRLSGLEFLAAQYL